VKTNPQGFPWGRNQPTRLQRAVLSALVASLAFGFLYNSYLSHPSRTSDFANVWFGAKMMLQGTSPYSFRIFNNGFPTLYPATSFVYGIPFTLFTERNASLIFVTLSALLMTYGITSDSWHRVPMLASAAFLDSVMAAQFTIVLTAALFLPWLSFLAPIKPQCGLPVLAASRARWVLMLAASAFMLVLAISFLLLPGWPRDWLANLRTAPYERAPIFSPVGWVVSLLLLRWRRREAWLVLVSALLPQTFMWYGSLMLLTVANTYREACVLSAVSTFGFAIASYALYRGGEHVLLLTYTIYICSTYVACTIAVLRRPNEGELPAWMKLFRPRGQGEF
jgi:hypothetical protein